MRLLLRYLVLHTNFINLGDKKSYKKFQSPNIYKFLGKNSPLPEAFGCLTFILKIWVLKFTKIWATIPPTKNSSFSSS